MSVDPAAPQPEPRWRAWARRLAPAVLVAGLLAAVMPLATEAAGSQTLTVELPAFSAATRLDITVHPVGAPEAATGGSFHVAPAARAFVHSVRGAPGDYWVEATLRAADGRGPPLGAGEGRVTLAEGVGRLRVVQQP